MIGGKSVEHFMQTEMGIGQTTWLLTAAKAVVGSARRHALVLKSCWRKWLVDHRLARSRYLLMLLLLVLSNEHLMSIRIANRKQRRSNGNMLDHCEE